ncbi:MAG: 4Fe-4S binding protein [Methanobacteriaceae archaeon]|nr:4Fe-4S binding protein [Methanobacteriaceae archaeon]
MNTTKTTLEFLEKLEKYGKELGILNIGYLNDLKKHQIKKNTGKDFNNAIILTMEMDQRILEEGPSDKAKEYNYQLYEHFKNITYKINNYIENEGFQTIVAIPNSDLIDFTKLGEAAGLGTIGNNGLLISPEHGPKQKISAILVKIENLPEREYKYQWIKEHCKDCKECVKNCPEDALIEKQDHVILDSDKCIGSKQGCGECIKSCPIYNKGYIETLKEYKKGII